MALSTGTSQGKRLSSGGLVVETLPVLSGSFIAGCVTAGFFLPGICPHVFILVAARVLALQFVQTWRLRLFTQSSCLQRDHGLSMARKSEPSRSA